MPVSRVNRPRPTAEGAGQQFVRRGEGTLPTWLAQVERAQYVAIAGDRYAEVRRRRYIRQREAGGARVVQPLEPDRCALGQRWYWCTTA
jgi:hypothetical protein